MGRRLHESDEIGRVVSRRTRSRRCHRIHAKKHATIHRRSYRRGRRPSCVLRFFVGTARRNHLSALGMHGRVERIAVVRLLADQDLRLRFNRVKIAGQLHKRGFTATFGVFKIAPTCTLEVGGECGAIFGGAWACSCTFKVQSKVAQTNSSPSRLHACDANLG